MISALAVFLLLSLSALVSASGKAFFSLTADDLKILKAEAHFPRNRIALRLLNEPEKLQVTHILLGCLANVSLLVVCNVFIDSCIRFDDEYAAVVVKIVLLASLLLLGDIFPKILALRDALTFSKNLSGLIFPFYYLFTPLSMVIIFFNKRLIRRKGLDYFGLSINELSQAIELSSDEIKDEKDLLEGIIRFGDKVAADAMTPRVDIAFIDIRLNFKEALDRVVETGYSRIPVFSGVEDTVKGILYGKDLLPYLNKPDNFRWQSLIRPAYFVPESKKIDDLLEEFKTDKIHVAIVVDEYGSVSGLITMEDVLEEIVGEISDEYDQEERQYIKLEDGSIIFEAKILLNDFYKATGEDAHDFEAVTGDAETLAGMILEIKGEFPERREIIKYGNYLFQILEIDKRRIRKIKFTKDAGSGNVPE